MSNLTPIKLKAFASARKRWGAVFLLGPNDEAPWSYQVDALNEYTRRKMEPVRVAAAVSAARLERLVSEFKLKMEPQPEVVSYDIDVDC